MGSWNLGWVRAREYILLNPINTIVRYSKITTPNVNWLMSRMEELEVPVAYTYELTEIYFTNIPGAEGDYIDGVIRLKASVDTVDRTFVHELGHHIDEIEGCTLDDRLIREAKYRARYMSDKYARKNVAEYFAVGFEVFYFGAPGERKKFRKLNPYLYRTITKLHQRYSRR